MLVRGIWPSCSNNSVTLAAPLLAQLLVQGRGTNCRCVALYLNYIAGDGQGLLA